ncbi:NADPH-dependent 7-cyano-7-deazaguanine reductase QueF [Faucicola boevrei]|uniref:NADPH-dependent 7-cyano-7-deazaguanine reductase QueF n=1 Tax=Faucicola boevrei TaxID=346665 RepID=UPI00037B6C8D|nr:NADPH-dependent 7-cyano-7-deazaguanine reductase QueF [Moraxella boevrei]
MTTVNQMHGILGQSTHYPKTYAPDILFPIARSLGREKLALKDFIGVDYWQIFELSWLNPQGISQVATARLIVPATSEFIIESKSLKLYLNSLNFTIFASVTNVQKTVENDLSNCLKTTVQLQIFSLDDDTLKIDKAMGECLDNIFDDLDKKVTLTDDVSPELLSIAKDEYALQHFHSHLLRSNCPVTNQPDWGTVEVLMDGLTADKADLLQYILSFRQHNGFHEQCVEQIFSDLTTTYQPKSLMVRAWYTRRGGIDINPVRVSDESLMPKFSRLVRQ